MKIVFKSTPSHGKPQGEHSHGYYLVQLRRTSVAMIQVSIIGERCATARLDTHGDMEDIWYDGAGGTVFILRRMRLISARILSAAASGASFHTQS